MTKVPCSHLKIQKLVYMYYVDYLCEYHEKLFEDMIYAYRLGPVIMFVYEKYKKIGSGFLACEDDTETYSEVAKKMPIRSRILVSKDGLNKIIRMD